MARHTLEVVADHPAPIERRVIVLQRGGDFLGDSGTVRGDETFSREGLDTLDHHAADHFQRRGRADLVRRDRAAHIEFIDQERHHGCCVRPRQQQRCLVSLWVDRREDCDVDIARGIAKDACRLFFAPGRHRVDVEEIRVTRNVRRDRCRGIEARSGGDGGNDDVGVRDGICCRVRKPRADLLAGLLQCRAVILWKQDIPGGDMFDPGLAQARGDRLPGFAESDEAEAGSIAGHCVSLR